MTDLSEWVPQVGRIYLEAKNLVENEDTVNMDTASTYGREYNTALTAVKDLSADDDYVLNTMNDVSTTTRRAEDRQPHAILKEVVLSSGKLMDHLGYSIPENHLRNDSSDMMIIQMDQHAEQNVEQTMDVSIESTLEQISHLREPPRTKEDLEKIVHDFEEEIGKEEPDHSQIQQFIQTASSKSTDVAANLLIIAIHHGILRVANLL